MMFSIANQISVTFVQLLSQIHVKKFLFTNSVTRRFRLKIPTSVAENPHKSPPIFFLKIPTFFFKNPHFYVTLC